MDIILGNQQNILTTDDEPIFQNWAPLPNPHNNNMYYHPNAGFVPVPETITFKIKDVIGAVETAQFSEFRLKAYQIYQPAQPVDWVDPVCYTDMGYPNDQAEDIELTENGVEFEFTPVLQFLNLLAAGSYSFSHYFIIQGLSGTSWQNISSYQHRLRLYVTNTPIYVSPPTYHFVHVHGSTLPHKDFNIYGDNWKIVGNPKVVLSSPYSGTHVTTVTDVTGTYQTVHIEEGLGGASGFSVQLADFYDQIGIFDPSVLSGFLTIVQGSSTVVGYINYTISINAIPALTASPTSLHFMAVKGVSEPEPQNITFLSTQDYEIQSSPWLTTTVETTVVDGLTQQIIVVRPIATANFSVGLYTGFVKLLANVNGVDEEIDILVTYDLQDFVNIEFSSESAAFTLDDQNLNFSTSNSDTYFDILLSVNAYEFFGAAAELTELTYKIPLFKNTQSFNIGRIIDRIMRGFQKPNAVGQFEYFPAEVFFTVSEKNNSDNSVIREFTSEAFTFVAGFSPQEFSHGSCILGRNLKPTRITPRTKTFINMYLPIGFYSLELKIDTAPAVILQTLNIAQNQVYSQELNFENYSITEGSTVVFRMTKAVSDSTSARETVTKTFKCFPEEVYSNTIIWEDFYKVRASFEFTGAYRFSKEFDHVTSSYYQNVSEFLEKLKSEKKSKFFINTGWILKDDIQVVEDLIENRKAWLVLPDGGLLELVAISKDVAGENTEVGLIEYEVEFQINQNNA
jgi:hypothetical protein